MTHELTKRAKSRIAKMRGRTLHQFMVEKTTEAFCTFRFAVETECPITLADGTTDFLDIFAVRGAASIACEIETTPRYVRVNAEKAATLGLPLWIVVPNKKVATAVTRKLKRVGLEPTGERIKILTLGHLPQALANYFPLFSPANSSWEKQKNKSLGSGKPRMAVPCQFGKSHSQRG